MNWEQFKKEADIKKLEIFNDMLQVLIIKIKYMQFDLEATRRENELLRKYRGI